MELYSRVDLIFPQTLWLPGAGDMYIILTSIGAYLEKHECSTPEFEYLNTCDLYSTDRPEHHDIELYTRVYANVIFQLEGRGVVGARVISRGNCLILELLCNHKYNTIFYPCPPL